MVTHALTNSHIVCIDLDTDKLFANVYTECPEKSTPL